MKVLNPAAREISTVPTSVMHIKVGFFIKYLQHTCHLREPQANIHCTSWSVVSINIHLHSIIWHSVIRAVILDTCNSK